MQQHTESTYWDCFLQVSRETESTQGGDFMKLSIKKFVNEKEKVHA